MIFLAIPIFGFLSYSIYAKEQIIRHGEALFVELVPADPRSLMQGDYMQLRYAIDREMISTKGWHSRWESSYAVIRQNIDKEARFVRLHDGGDLKAGEKLLHVRNTGWRKHYIAPNSFFFQEGHAKYYENAKYGVFKFNGPRDYLLVDLADKDKNIIRVTEKQKQERLPPQSDQYIEGITIPISPEQRQERQEQ